MVNTTIKYTQNQEKHILCGTGSDIYSIMHTHQPEREKMEMQGKIEKISPTKDLGEYLVEIRDEYDAKGLGIQFKDPSELCMIMEKNLYKAGAIKERSYKSVVNREKLAPTIVRSEDYTAITDYKILKIHPTKQTAKELLDDHAKGVIKILAGAGALDFSGAAYEKDGTLFLVLESYDEDGNKFSDDIIKRMEELV